MAGSDINDTVGRIRDLLLSQSRAGRLRNLMDSIYGAAPVSTPGMLGMQHQQSASQTDPALERYMAGKESATRGVPLEAPAFSPDDLIGSGLLKGMLGGGAALAGTFIGKGAKTWNAVAMSRAQQMADAGVDPRKIWAETGVWRGPDGHWRQEIPDNTFDLIQQKGTPLEYMQDRVAEYPQSMHQSVKHTPLFTAYPDISEANTRLTTSSIGGHIPPQHGMPETFELPFRHTVDGDFTNRAKQRSSAIHELQHGVQSREGFARGGSPDEFRGKSADYNYKRLAGEAEARATQARLQLNEAQRRALFPEDSYDVPIAKLIFRK